MKAFLVIFFIFNFFLITGQAQSTAYLLPFLCGSNSGPSTGQIIKAQMGVDTGMGEYPTPTPSCNYTMIAEAPNQRIRFSIGTGRAEVNAILPNGACSDAGLQVIDTNGTILDTLCGIINRNLEFSSTGDRMLINFFTIGGNSSVANFTAHFTSFDDAADCGSNSNFFQCSNGRCISPGWRCDATLINNCGDTSDNSLGPPGNCSVQTTTATTATTAVTTQTTTTTAAAGEIGDSTDIALIVGAALGGAVAAYALYWLLWRPGYLVWRCSCWRHWCQANTSIEKPQPLGKTQINPTATNKTTDPSNKNSLQFSPSPDLSGSKPPAPQNLGGISREPQFFY